MTGADATLHTKIGGLKRSKGSQRKKLKAQEAGNIIVEAGGQ